MSDLRFDPLEDGISVVEYVDHMGSDSSVVRAARVSYAGDKQDFELKRDEKLIRYLADNHHGTPFEHTAITFHVAAPIFIVRQWHRHRIGFSYNEVSRRYTSEDIRLHEPRKYRLQDGKNKQGSRDAAPDGMQVWAAGLYERSTEHAIKAYELMVSEGVSREQARMILPQSLYTRMYVTGNLRSFAHFYGLRADEHAQQEIRVYAEAIGEILKRLFPLSWSALTAEMSVDETGGGK